MSTYVMTDIHGHYDAMKRMLGKIGFSSGDRLIFAGDYIDRGPDSYEMLRWIENPGENVVLVRGNHDEEFRCYVEVMGMIFQKRRMETSSGRIPYLCTRRPDSFLPILMCMGLWEILLKKGRCHLRSCQSGQGVSGKCPISMRLL